MRDTETVEDRDAHVETAVQVASPEEVRDDIGTGVDALGDDRPGTGADEVLLVVPAGVCAVDGLPRGASALQHHPCPVLRDGRIVLLALDGSLELPPLRFPELPEAAYAVHGDLHAHADPAEVARKSVSAVMRFAVVSRAHRGDRCDPPDTRAVECGGYLFDVVQGAGESRCLQVLPHEPELGCNPIPRKG